MSQHRLFHRRVPQSSDTLVLAQHIAAAVQVGLILTNCSFVVDRRPDLHILEVRGIIVHGIRVRRVPDIRIQYRLTFPEVSGPMLRIKEYLRQRMPEVPYRKDPGDAS